MDSNLIIDLYRHMLRIRRFEEKAAELYVGGHIFGFCHLYIGQEAVVTGIHSVLKNEDSQITSYRDHAHMLVCGVEPKFVMAELCGKDTGCSRGLGGSMHMYSKQHNFFGGNGIVGAQVPIGTGIALANKYKNSPGVSVVYFGDGAANQGQVYESMNMASLWSLPVLYVLENNMYAMGTHQNRSTSGDFKKRWDSFGIASYFADGMDVLDVRDIASQAREYVCTECKPAILYADTYRYRGHSMSDPATYRSRREVEDIRGSRDPISRIRNIIENELLIEEKVIKDIDSEIDQVMSEAADFAIQSEFPNINTMLKIAEYCEN